MCNWGFIIKKSNIAHCTLKNCTFRKLVHYFPIALFTDNPLGPVGRICRCDIFVAFSTFSLKECTSISHFHPFLMSLIRMLRWDWKGMLYVESELLSHDFKWFFCDLAFNCSSKELINIFLCNFESHNFFVILRYRKWLKGTTFKFFLKFVMPTKSAL